MLLQNDRFAKFLTALSLSKEGGSKLPEFSPILQPVVDVENRQAEMDLYARVFRCGGFGDITSGAGDVPGVMLANPDNSGCIVVVEACLFSHVAAGGSISIGWDTDTTAGTYTSSASSFLDTRRQGPLATIALPQGRVRELAAPTVTGYNTFAQMRVPADVTQDLTPVVAGVVLFPGRAITVQSGNALQRIQVSFRWRERSMEKGEQGPT